MTTYSDRFSCSTCQRRWGGLAEAHCTTCCKHFVSVTGFDAHRHEGTCFTTAELMEPRPKSTTGKPRMEALSDPRGIIWVTSRKIVAEPSQLVKVASEA